jgi:hypothetical protein
VGESELLVMLECANAWQSAGLPALGLLLRPDMGRAPDGIERRIDGIMDEDGNVVWLGC